MLISPLRYPGGKGRMFKFVDNLIKENELGNYTYTEPFSGGFGIGVKLLSSGRVKNAIINDIDEHVYAFWYSVFNETQEFLNLIQETPIDLDNWKNQKDIYENYKGASLLKKGFAAFYLNRTNYSGVITGGRIGGVAQKSKYALGCRMNKCRLISQISELAIYKEHVKVYNYDAIDFTKKVIIPMRNNVFVNFDPPYVVKGAELYKNFYEENDHVKLAKFIKENLKDVYWMMTYDDCLLIKQLYKEYSPKEYVLTYMAGKRKAGQELLIRNFNLK